MDFWGITDCGKVRRENQDVFKTFRDDEKGVAALVVCDGMGGVRAGNIASMMAAETFIRHMGECLGNTVDIDDAALEMSNAIYAANKAVYDKSMTDEDFAGMGTTLTAVISLNDGEVVANVGDSRAYHITQSAIKQITKDHTVVEDMVNRGDLTRAEARRHPKKNLITRAVGTSNEEVPDLFFLNLHPGEHVLLCSDGLTNLLMDSEILFEVQHEKCIRKCCEKLIETALSRGAPDNVTAVIFRRGE